MDSEVQQPTENHLTKSASRRRVSREEKCPDARQYMIWHRSRNAASAVVLGSSKRRHDTHAFHSCQACQGLVLKRQETPQTPGGYSYLGTVHFSKSYLSDILQNPFSKPELEYLAQACPLLQRAATLAQSRLSSMANDFENNGVGGTKLGISITGNSLAHISKEGLSCTIQLLFPNDAWAKATLNMDFKLDLRFFTKPNKRFFTVNEVVCNEFLSRHQIRHEYDKSSTFEIFTFAGKNSFLSTLRKLITATPGLALTYKVAVSCPFARQRLLREKLRVIFGHGGCSMVDEPLQVLDTYRFSANQIEDDPAATVLYQRPNVETLNCDASFTLAKNWLHDCGNHHANCSSSVGLLPSRVIDVGTRFPIRIVKLHWAEEGERGVYATLSYCWGGKQPFTATRNTVQDLTDGVPFSRLPSTLHDAITTTFKLGLRYIWIDSLCIIQDDQEDVAREVSNMAQIYSESTLTISAASARSVDDGFLQKRGSSLSSALKIRVETEKGIGAIYMDKPLPYKPILDPIHLRAWTLQEHALAQRILLYSTHEVWWICASDVLSSRWAMTEERRISASNHFKRPRSHSSIDDWRSILRDYTRRFLTFPGDRLPGIAGIAAQYSKIFKSEYHAGLWGSHLLSELLWTSVRSDISRPFTRRDPSWSWASVDGEISHTYCPEEDECRLNVPRCEVRWESGAELIVTGLLGGFHWTSDRKYLLGRKVAPRVALTRADAAEPLRGAEDAYINVWALPVTKDLDRGLLLINVTGNRYRRVGIFLNFQGETEMPTDMRTISIR